MRLDRILIVALVLSAGLYVAGPVEAARRRGNNNAAKEAQKKREAMLKAAEAQVASAQSAADAADKELAEARRALRESDSKAAAEAAKLRSSIDSNPDLKQAMTQLKQVASDRRAAEDVVQQKLQSDPSYRAALEKQQKAQLDLATVRQNSPSPQALSDAAKTATAASAQVSKMFEDAATKDEAVMRARLAEVQASQKLAKLQADLRAQTRDNPSLKTQGQASADARAAVIAAEKKAAAAHVALSQAQAHRDALARSR